MNKQELAKRLYNILEPVRCENCPLDTECDAEHSLCDKLKIEKEEVEV